MLQLYGPQNQLRQKLVKVRSDPLLKIILNIIHRPWLYGGDTPSTLARFVRSSSFNRLIS